MASLKELKIIQQAKREYETAKARGDAAGMKAAHLRADQARGFTTTTKVNQQGQYYQSVESAKPPKAPVRTPPVASTFRNAPAPIKITPEQQEKNTQTFLAELKSKQGIIAAGAAGVGAGLTGGGKQYMDPRTQQVIESNAGLDRAFTGGQITGSIPGFAAPYGAAGKSITAAVSKIPAIAKLGPIGQKIAGSVATDLSVGLPLNANYAVNSEGLKGKDALKSIALNTGIDIATGGLIEGLPAALRALRNADNKIPVLADGKVRYVDAPVSSNPPGRNIPAPTPRVVPRRPVQDAPQPEIPARNTVDTPVLKPQPETPATSTQITPEQRKGNLGVVASRKRAAAENGNLGQNKFVDLGADTNKSLPKYEISKVRTNTIENSPMFEKAKEYMDEPDYAYEVVSEKRSLAEAKRRLQVDFDGEVEDLPLKANFDGVDMDTSMGIMEQYIKEAELTGNWTRAKEWSKLIREKGTQGGQMIQAFAKYSRTPEGAVVKGQQEVGKVEREIKKTNPNLFKKVDAETQEVMDAFKQAEQDTFEPIGDILKKFVEGKAKKPTSKTPAAESSITSVEDAVSKLTDKNIEELIGVYTEDASKKLASLADIAKSKKKQVAPLQQAFDDLTRELYKIAQETLPKTEKAKSTVKATDILRSAMENKQNYQQVWENAKFLLQQKYANNPEAMQLLSDFFEKNAIPTYSKKTFEKAYGEAVKALGVDIKDLILNNPQDKKGTLAKIGEYLINETGASGEEAAILTKQISDKYVELVNGKNWNMLENLIKERVKKAPQSEFIKIRQMMNMGAYYSGRYAKATEAATAKAINRTAKDFGQDLNNVIKQSKGDKQKLMTDIQNYILYNTGVQGEDADILAINIMTKYNEIIKAKTDSTLKRMFREVPRKGQKTMYQKVMELINMGAYDDEAIRDLIKAKNNVPVLDSDDVKNILENMKKAEDFPEGDYMRRMYQAKAEQIISDKVPKEFREKFRALQRLSMMTNLRTLFTRNPLGNVILGTAENVKNIPAAGIDRLVAFKTGQRTTTLNPNLGAQAKGFGQGLKEWAQDIRYGVDTSPSRGQLELPRGKTFQDKGIGKGLNFLDTILIRGLQLGDRPFYQAAYGGRMAELKRLGITGEEAEKQARLFALDRVFQNDSALSGGLQAIRKGMNDMVGGFPLGDLIIPFAQTPANILDKLLDYSPAGLTKALYQLGTTAGKGTFDQKKFVDTLARTFTGAGISLLTYAMLKDAMITGKLSDNKDVRNAQMQAGMQPYSIKINGKWYSYEWAQPVAGIIAFTVDAVNAGADKDDIVQAAAEGGTAGVDTVFSLSVLQGLASMMSGLSPAAGIVSSLLSSTSQATPTGLGQIARVIDPVVRETYDPNMIKQQGNRLLARIPLASRMLPAKVDINGQEILQSQGRGLGARAFENFLAPYRVAEETNDPVNLELMRLQKQTGDSAVLLNTAPKYIEEGGESYVFNSNDFVNFQRTMGQTAYRNIQKLITSPEYRNMDDDEKAKAVKSIQTEANERARMEFFKNKGMPQTLVLSESQQKKYAETASLGVDEDQYINTYYATKGVEGLKDDSGKTIRLSESYLKKKAIDKANPGASQAELMALYHAFDVSQKVWGFN